jgi:hypothetical protein
VIVGQQLNNNEKLRFPATLVNAEEKECKAIVNTNKKKHICRQPQL